MTTKSDDGMGIPLTLIGIGAGMFVGSYSVEDPATRSILKIGGALSAVAGVALGGKALFGMLGFSKVLKPKEQTGEVVSTDTLSPGEKKQFSGRVSGEIISPANLSHLDRPLFVRDYVVVARLVNDTPSAVRVAASVKSNEDYWITDNGGTGTSLGSVNIPSGGSVEVRGEIAFGTLFPSPFYDPKVVLSLLIDGVEVDKVNFTYSDF